MNEWVKKSIERANGPGYLDDLLKVYPVAEETKRRLPRDKKEALRRLFSRPDDQALLKALLGMPRFPVKDPYVAFLRRSDVFLEGNLVTVRRLARRVRALGFRGMIAALEEPKEFNRQIGTLFGKWLRKLGYPFLEENDFLVSDGIAFLEGSETRYLHFANEQLGCGLSKKPDFIAKVGARYIIGEAKFLTDYGGHQNAQFHDALRLLQGNSGNALRVAVLDGVVWIQDHNLMFRAVCQLEKPAFSALLLKDFLESL